MKDVGVGGMVRSAAWLDHTAGMEVLSIGRSAIDKEDCVMELSGRSLFFRIALRGGWIWISATGMDEADQPELLFNIGDGPEGWIVVRRFCQALERSGITSLHPRPLQVGEPGASDCFVIG